MQRTWKMPFSVFRCILLHFRTLVLLIIQGIFVSPPSSIWISISTRRIFHFNVRLFNSWMRANMCGICLAKCSSLGICLQFLFRLQPLHIAFHILPPDFSDTNPDPPTAPSSCFRRGDPCCCFWRRRRFGLTFLSCCGRLIKINEVRWLFILLTKVSTITWISPPNPPIPPIPPHFRWPWGAENMHNVWLHFKLVNCAENETGCYR